MHNCSSHRGRILSLAALTVLVSWATLSWSQPTQQRVRNFVNTGETESYLNYGRKEYEAYPQVLTARNRYDRLGGFLMRGYQVFSMNTHDPSRSGLSDIDRHVLFLQWFNALIIGSDSYRGWNYTLTVGEDIRSKFTSLTFKDPRWNGIRLDTGSSDNNFTLLFTRGASTTQTPYFSTFSASPEQSTVPQLGFHWQTNLGSVLQVGATYFNQHMSDALSNNGSFFKGDTPYPMLPPSFIIVAIEDDSPEETKAAAIIRSVDIVVAGVSRGQPVRRTSVRGRPELGEFDASLVPKVSGVTVTSGRPAIVTGRNRALYEFKLPDVVTPPDSDYVKDPGMSLQGITITSVKFLLDVAGDYKIGLRQKYLFFDEDLHTTNVKKGYKPGDRRYVNPFTGKSGTDWNAPPDESSYRIWPTSPDPSLVQSNPFLAYKWDTKAEDVFYTVLRAEGQTIGEANRKVVSFDYGIPTAQSLYGLDWKFTLKGLKVSGELSTNPQNFIFPVGRNAGDRSSKRRTAYFVNASKGIGPADVGVEFFRLDPDFSGNYDSRRGGMAFFTDKTPPNYNVSNMQEFGIMGDNDDNDQWSDESQEEIPDRELPDSGIFPGLDENGDLIPDTDQNGNGLPDWTEAILFYDADPPEFVYGIDFNNNGVVDFRENDDLPDYPYRRDRKGIHALGILNKLKGFGDWISVGHYDMEEIAGGGTAKTTYLRYEYNHLSPIFGQIRLNDDIKWVKDSIRDDVYIWRDIPLDQKITHPILGVTDARNVNSQLFPPDADPLSMRNSLVNTLFFESRFNQITDLNIINNVQYIRNSQRADTFADSTRQDDAVLSHTTMVNKIDYTIRLGDLRIKPMFKHLLLRDAKSEDDSSYSITSYSIYTPILRLNFGLTAKSSVQLGFQGFPGLGYKFIDRVDDTKNFHQWDLVFMFTNRSDYWGYNIANQIGFQRTSKEFDDSSMSSLNRTDSRIFFDLVIGY
jgi:hypothetical protein